MALPGGANKEEARNASMDALREHTPATLEPSVSGEAGSRGAEEGRLRLALTREVSPRIAECELSYVPRQSIDLQFARLQHREYEECLQELGCTVRRIPGEPDLPDSVFVEDTAIILDEIAIVTRPGAESRRQETESVARVLGSYRELRFIQPPGTLDGGDVLRIGRDIYTGLSRRTDPSALEQLRSLARPFGHQVKSVRLRDCLHLKSAATQVADGTLLINPAWVDASVFADITILEVDPLEQHAANALLVGNTVLYPNAFPRTRRRLEDVGISVRTVDVSELAKAEGGVTCCSLILDA